jgi:hypothetical protein
LGITGHAFLQEIGLHAFSSSISGFFIITESEICHEVAHCLKLNVTINNIVASRRMLPYGRSFCNAGGEHDESTQQAKVVTRDPSALSESKENREENDAG